MRVIIDNDFSGDPDDLFALVHHVLSPSVEIPLIIASHLSGGDEWDPSDRQASNAKARADEPWVSWDWKEDSKW
jgi:purine nucleosidase